MKVYTLLGLDMTEDSIGAVVIGVFDKPKTARKWFDGAYNLETKNKWQKNVNNVRVFKTEATYYYIQEHTVQKEK